jgi:CRISPR-associated protein Csb2
MVGVLLRGMVAFLLAGGPAVERPYQSNPVEFMQACRKHTLFSALIAAHHDTFGTESERTALAWFQRLDAPEVSAGAAGVGNAVVTFVPTNYAGKSGSSHPDQRGKQPRTFPIQGPSSPVVHFIWRGAEPDEPVRQALSALVARVPSLGRACSLVRMSLSDAPEVSSHVPDQDGEVAMRVFGEGRMEELEALFNAGQRPQPGPQKLYRRVEATEEVQPASSCFGEMIVLRKMPGPGLPIEASLTLTAATRKALLKIAGENDLMCDMLSGHGAHPHCAFVPLPFTGYEHANGRLLGVGILLPRAISLQERRRVLRSCSLLKTINVRDALASWTVEVAGFDVPQKTLLPKTWNEPSHRWSTVTPILLDRFPKRNLTVETILEQACERIGLPKPIDISHGPYSTSSGVPPVPEFRLARSEDERQRWGVHATLRFAVPVRGPVVLGAGRYFGLGLMKPVRENRE